MRVAALDLGSNTSLLMIAEMDGRRIERVLHDETTITKLGQGVHAHRRFHPEALQRMQDCLSRYASTIAQHRCEKVIAVATSAARDVSNGQELLSLGARLQIPIHIIDGQREAQLTFEGALSDRGNTRGISVIDVGGGSTEIIASRDGQPRGTSVDVGSVRLTELFVKRQPIPSEQLQEIRAYASVAFQKAPLPEAEQEVVAVAGTPTTLAALDQRREFDENFVHGYRLKLSTIDEWIERLAKMSVEERERLPGMQPKRSDVIVTGSIILATAIRALGREEVTVSTRGVRYGVALEWQSF
jgi:exopolyphosphatase/guanosine-5'-triphosphate,3'-diphosphate pyrophosphatase